MRKMSWVCVRSNFWVFEEGRDDDLLNTWVKKNWYLKNEGMIY